MYSVKIIILKLVSDSIFWNLFSYYFENKKKKKKRIPPPKLKIFGTYKLLLYFSI